MAHLISLNRTEKTKREHNIKLSSSTCSLNRGVERSVSREKLMTLLRSHQSRIPEGLDPTRPTAATSNKMELEDIRPLSTLHRGLKTKAVKLYLKSVGLITTSSDTMPVGSGRIGLFWTKNQPCTRISNGNLERFLPVIYLFFFKFVGN